MAATTPTLSPFLLDHPLPAMSFDAKTRKIIAANKAATKALGYSPVALKKLTLSEVVTLPPRVKLNASFSATATSGSGDQFAVKAYLKVIKEKNRSHHFIFFTRNRITRTGKTYGRARGKTLAGRQNCEGKPQRNLPDQ
jgi:PAS domain-containing protein